MAKFIFVPEVRNLHNYIEILKIIMLLLGIKQAIFLNENLLAIF